MLGPPAKVRVKFVASEAVLVKFHLMQGPNDVYAGNWLDDVLAAGGGQHYTVVPQL